MLNNVVAVIPATSATGDKETTVKIDKMTVEALDFDRLKKGFVPDRRAALRQIAAFQGIAGDDHAFAMLAPYGISKAPVDLALDYLIDPDKKALTISKLEVNLRGQSRMTLALIMDGIDDKMSQMARPPRTMAGCAPRPSRSSILGNWPRSCRPSPGIRAPRRMHWSP